MAVINVLKLFLVLTLCLSKGLLWVRLLFPFFSFNRSTLGVFFNIFVIHCNY